MRSKSSSSVHHLILLFIIPLFVPAFLIWPNADVAAQENKRYSIKPYPHTVGDRPDIPSPATTPAGVEMILSRTEEDRYTWFPVTVTDRPGRWKQLAVNGEDFPTLARTGLHSEIELDICKTITGRSIVEVTELGRPGRLSEGGFMHQREDIISVLRGDNRLVKKMGLRHPQLARALFHVINLINIQLKNKHQLKRDRHRYNYHPFQYRNKWISLLFEGTKGGQQSIFRDEITGAMYVRVQRQIEQSEEEFLRERYGNLGPEKLDQLKKLLFQFNTGEMQPYYIQRYGFYEGHTYWRADPIAIALIFGLRTIEAVESAFSGQLYRVMTSPFTEEKREENH